MTSEQARLLKLERELLLLKTSVINLVGLLATDDLTIAQRQKALVHYRQRLADQLAEGRG